MRLYLRRREFIAALGGSAGRSIRVGPSHADRNAALASARPTLGPSYSAWIGLSAGEGQISIRLRPREFVAALVGAAVWTTFHGGRYDQHCKLVILSWCRSHPPPIVPFPVYKKPRPNVKYTETIFSIRRSVCTDSNIDTTQATEERSRCGSPQTSSSLTGRAQ